MRWTRRQNPIFKKLTCFSVGLSFLVGWLVGWLVWFCYVVFGFQVDSVVAAQFCQNAYHRCPYFVRNV